MRRCAPLALCLAALVLTAAPAAGSPPPGPTPPLATSGRWITDADGRAVIVHGVNMVYKRPPYYPGAIGFNDADAKFLRRHGFDAVRLGVIYTGVEPSPGRYSAGYLDHIAGTQRMLARQGIFSLLDFHQDLYAEKFTGEGFPSWAGRNRMVIVLERAEDADGSWHVERRDPFSDYRRLWNNAPKPIVSVGVNADTDGLKVRASAEIGDITWIGP